MGYDLHITRKQDWADETGPEITVEEWVAYVRQDPEFALAPETGPYFATWNGSPDSREHWLDYFEGNLYTKRPDEPFIEKMVQIARHLGAKVQGDDGEVYPGGGQPPRPEEGVDEPPVIDRQPPHSAPRPWWSRWLGS